MFTDMDLDSMCCLAVRGSLFMGSHDRVTGPHVYLHAHDALAFISVI